MMGVNLRNNWVSNGIPKRIDIISYRCSHSFAVKDIGAHGRFMYIDFTVGTVNYAVEQTTTDKIRRIDGSSISKTYSTIRAKRGCKTPFRTSGALLSQKQDVVLWRTTELA